MKDFKTTLTGIILAILIAVQPLTTADGFDLKKDWLQVVIAGAIALFGWLSKDANDKPKE
jgi:hypothetical protein